MSDVHEALMLTNVICAWDERVCGRLLFIILKSPFVKSNVFGSRSDISFCSSDKNVFF